MGYSSARNYVRTPDNFRLNWPRVWTLRTLTSQNVRAKKERSREASDQASSSGSGPSTKKRVVQRRTVEKWIAENDKATSTASWLKFETAPPPDRDRVAVLKCAVCTQFSNLCGTSSLLSLKLQAMFVHLLSKSMLVAICIVELCKKSAL